MRPETTFQRAPGEEKISKATVSSGIVTPKESSRVTRSRTTVSESMPASARSVSSRSGVSGRDQAVQALPQHGLELRVQRRGPNVARTLVDSLLFMGLPGNATARHVFSLALPAQAPIHAPRSLESAADMTQVEHILGGHVTP